MIEKVRKNRASSLCLMSYEYEILSLDSFSSRIWRRCCWRRRSERRWGGNKKWGRTSVYITNSHPPSHIFIHIFSHDCAHVENIKSRNKFPLLENGMMLLACSKKTSQKREGSDVCCAESGMYLKNKKKKDIEIEWAEALKMKRDGKKSTRSWAWRQQNSTWQAKSSSSSINVWGELGKDDDEKLREK